MLARGGANRLQEILRKAKRLPGPKRGKVLAQLVALSGLRRLGGRLTMEIVSPGDLRQSAEGGAAKGRAEGEARGEAGGKATGMMEMLYSQLGTKYASQMGTREAGGCDAGAVGLLGEEGSGCQDFGSFDIEAYQTGQKNLSNRR
jgi:hypothetical protein